MLVINNKNWLHFRVNNRKQGANLKFKFSGNLTEKNCSISVSTQLATRTTDSQNFVIINIISIDGIFHFNNLN